MTHCTVVTSAPKSFSIAGRATLSAVKSLAMTRTASPIAIRPAIVELLSESSDLVIQRCRAFYNEVTERSKLVIAKNEREMEAVWMGDESKRTAALVPDYN